MQLPGEAAGQVGPTGAFLDDTQLQLLRHCGGLYKA